MPIFYTDFRFPKFDFCGKTPKICENFRRGGALEG